MKKLLPIRISKAKGVYPVAGHRRIAHLSFLFALLVAFTSLAPESPAYGATEFVSVVDTGGASDADFSSLSTWESIMTNTVLDIGSTATQVFSGTVTTSIASNTTVYQCRSGVYQSVSGTMVHDTKAGQALVKEITAGASFSIGDRWYEASDCTGDYFEISNTGDTAIAVVKCRTTDGSADTTAVTIDGWTTSTSNYIKIWTDPSEGYRHEGKWDDSKYRMDFDAPADWNSAVDIVSYYVRLEGVQIDFNDGGYSSTGAINVQGTEGETNNEVYVSGCILRSSGSSGGAGNGIFNSGGGLNARNAKIFNNIIYGFNSYCLGIQNQNNIYYYNNTVFGCGDGIQSSGVLLKNNISVDNNGFDFYGGTWAVSGSTNNISSDITADDGNLSNGIINHSSSSLFSDESNSDFHLASSDSGAKDHGADLSADSNLPFNHDIDGDERSGSWDIGADEWHGTILQSPDIQSNTETANLVGYWSFDGKDITGVGVGSSAVDTSGNNHNGLISGATPKAGKKGSGLLFDGTSNEVTVGNTGESIGSVSFWMKPSSTSQYILDLDGGSHYVRLNAGTLSAFGFTDPTIYVEGVATTTVSNTDWHHITITTGTSFSASNLVIGKVSSNYFSGTLDEIRIYSGVLSSEQARTLANLGQIRLQMSLTDKMTDGLVGMWSFDGPDIQGVGVGSSAVDRSGNGNNGLISGATPAIGKHGSALEFDGVDDYVDAGSDASLDDIETQGGGGMTVSAWVKPRSYGENGGAILCKEEVSYNWCFGLDNSGSNRLKFQRDYSSADLAARSEDDSFSENEWQHVVLTWNGGSTAATDIYFYVNATEKSHYTDQNGTAGKVSDANQIMFIGNSRWGANTFDGEIDEVRIYDRILTSDEIGDLYQLGQVKVSR